MYGDGVHDRQKTDHVGCICEIEMTSDLEENRCAELGQPYRGLGKCYWVQWRPHTWSHTFCPNSLSKPWRLRNPLCMHNLYKG